MNYRHAFHAGNFADVFKHALLTRILLYLTRKDAPLAYLDTHAGAGVYDPGSDEARRGGEWRGGIGRLGAIESEADARLIEPWLELVGPREADGRPVSYPGSPAIASRLLRRRDRLILNEPEPETRALLNAALGRDRRVVSLGLDGYVALGANIPPRERRGLVLLDPPFEAPDEFDRLAKATIGAVAKWREGVYALWHPVKRRADADSLAAEIAAGTTRPTLRLTLEVGPSGASPRGGGPPLVGCALIVVNPPFTLEREARELLPFLARRLARGPGARAGVEWLVHERR